MISESTALQQVFTLFLNKRSAMVFTKELTTTPIDSCSHYKIYRNFNWRDISWVLGLDRLCGQKFVASQRMKFWRGRWCKCDLHPAVLLLKLILTVCCDTVCWSSSEFNPRQCKTIRFLPSRFVRFWKSGGGWISSEHKTPDRFIGDSVVQKCLSHITSHKAIGC